MTKQIYEAQMAKLNTDYLNEVQSIQAQVHDLKARKARINENFQKEMKEVNAALFELSQKPLEVKSRMLAARAELTSRYAAQFYTGNND